MLKARSCYTCDVCGKTWEKDGFDPNHFTNCGDLTIRVEGVGNLDICDACMHGIGGIEDILGGRVQKMRSEARRERR